MTDILAADVFPFLRKENDPLLSKDEDYMPDKYGP